MEDLYLVLKLMSLNRYYQKIVKKYAVGMNSGTDALYLTLRSYDIGPGDEVITTPLSWIATTNAIELTGATPLFVDIGTDLNIDVSLIESAITENTKVILPVHLLATCVTWLASIK